MEKSIKRNYLYNILLNVSKVIFPLITAPYIARVLEPDGVGLFNFSNTYAGYFALMAALGIPLYGIREIAKCKNDVKKQEKLFSEIFSLSIVSTLFCMAIFLITLLIVEQLNKNIIIFLISGIVLYLTPFKIDWFFSGKEEFGYITYRSLLIKTISVIFLFILVHEKNDLIIYVLINALSQVVNELWNFIKLLNLGIRPKFTLNILAHIKPLILLFLSSVAVSLYTVLDTIMLGFIRDYTEVGYYNSASAMSKVLVPIVTSLSVVAIPRISNYNEENNWSQISELMNKSFSLVCFLAFPISLMIFSLSPVFVPLFFGEKFLGAIVPLQIVIFIIISVGLNNLLGVQLMASVRLDKQLLISILTGAVFNILLNSILIPFYGAIGACISSVCAETLIVVVMLHYVYKLTPIRFRFRGIFQDGLIAVVFIPLCLIFNTYFSGWVYVFLCIITCSIEYLLIQYILKNPILTFFIDYILLVRKNK